MLRCGHNFCLSCLESCISGGQKMSKCPECRHPFSRQEFTCNRVLANLAKKAHRLRLDQELLPATSLVGFCEDHDEPLKLFCQQDLVPICVICRDLPQHRGHDFLPTKNAVEYAKVRSESGQYCLNGKRVVQKGGIFVTWILFQSFPPQVLLTWSVALQADAHCTQ